MGGEPYFVKVRRTGEKRFFFLAPGGKLSGLRVHASRFESHAKAKAFIEQIKDDNPGREWKAVKI